MKCIQDEVGTAVLAHAFESWPHVPDPVALLGASVNVMFAWYHVVVMRLTRGMRAKRFGEDVVCGVRDFSLFSWYEICGCFVFAADVQ